MSLEKFLEYLETLSEAARASDDENVRKLAAALFTMRGSILAGGPFLESYLDQQAALNVNLKAALIAVQQKG